jgi:rhamnulokinase
LPVRIDRLEVQAGPGTAGIDDRSAAGDDPYRLGGGSKNQLLNQFTADATGRRVVAGPAEATATGNILLQAVALGHIGSLEDGREVVRRSSDASVYEPWDQDPWDEAYGRLLEVMDFSGH